MMSDTISPAPRRRSPTIPLLLLVTLVAVFLSWRSCSFGLPMTDAQLELALSGRGSAADVQRALTQLGPRLLAEDSAAVRLLPQAFGLVRHENPEIRKELAWALGDAKGHAEVVPVLKELLRDAHVLVRGQAALALANHGDGSGRAAIIELLGHHPVLAPASGTLSQCLRRGEPARPGVRLARIDVPGTSVPSDVPSPMDGRVAKTHAVIGKPIREGDLILEVSPAEPQILSALKGLQLVGRQEDARAVQRLVESDTNLGDLARSQAQKLLEILRTRAETPASRPESR
jgi:hypothetical protein